MQLKCEVLNDICSERKKVTSLKLVSSKNPSTKHYSIIQTEKRKKVYDVCYLWRNKNKGCP